MKRQVANHPHLPSAFRVNGPMRNVHASYTAFGVEPGDKLYLPPDKRRRI